MKYSQRPRCLLGFRKSVASAVSAMSAVVIWSGLVSPVGGEDRVAVPLYDRGILSEMAQDVLRHGATGRNQSVPDSTSPAGDAEEEIGVVGSAPDPAPPVTHIAPEREGIRVYFTHVLGAKEDASGVGDRRLSIQLMAATP